MNRKIALAVRNAGCTLCKMSTDAESVCETASGPRRADIVVVDRAPPGSGFASMLHQELIECGLDPDDMAFAHALKCRNWDVNPSKTDQKACIPYLDQELALIKPKWVLALGNEALYATTGHSGITKYRGRIIERKGFSVIPTVSPAAVMRNPGQLEGFRGDLRLFAAQVLGKPALIDPPKMTTIDTKAKVKKLKKILMEATLLSFDIETSSTPPGDEFAADAKIVSLCGTMEVRGKLMCWLLPLYHPESPFRTTWKSVLKYLGPALHRVPKTVAHNGKYDCRWLKQFGVDVPLSFDTMLACHLLDENRLKGLKIQATSRFGVEPWAIKTKDLLNTPLDQVLHYCGLDTYFTYHLYREVREELIAQPRLLRIFKFLLMPTNEILIDAERRGIWVDQERLSTNTKIAFDTLADLHEKLMEHVPEQTDPRWPTNAKGHPMPVNFNASNFARWFLFDYLELPVLARGKDKPDGSPGMPSMREGLLLEMRALHPVVNLMLERVKWQKFCTAFLPRYQELMDERDRIHTTFKLYGTVTGRLSSGKPDQDKVTAARNIRGVNLQQVPRDNLIRGVFGAEPGYTFVEADFSQAELRIAAFMSRDPTMLTLYQSGEDIHMATASWVLGVPRSKVTKDDRKKAKAVNFGFVYGMGAKKFVLTAFEKYELVFTENEAEGIRSAYFKQFPGLLRWHARQRRLVNNNARVQSPIGRIRHLPDIRSGDFKVRGEAERQAINSPVQSFASDMTLMSMVLIQRQFREQGIQGKLLGMVHDAILFEIKDDYISSALPVIKRTMENLPLHKWFGVNLDVPIIADLKIGEHWGDAKEISAEEVFMFEGK